MSNDLMIPDDTLAVATQSEAVTKTIEARRTLAIYFADIEKTGSTDTLSKLPTKPHVAIMTDRFRSLNGSLNGLEYSVAARDRAVAAVAAMFTSGSWPSFKVEDPKKTVAAYVSNLMSYPAWAVEAVCKAIANGQVTDLNPDFPPSGARIAQLCAAKIADMQEEKAKFARVLAIKIERGASVSNEERAAVKEKYDAWKTDRPDPAITENEELLSKLAARSKAFSEKVILRDYAARGMDPIRTDSGVLVSASLLKNIQEKAQRDSLLPRKRRD